MKFAKLILIFFIYPFSCFSASLGFGTSGEDVTITALDGVVWDRDKQEIEINEKATMIQGGTKLIADKIIVNYTEKGGKQEIVLLKAVENVTITSGSETLTGSNALYEPNKGLAVLTGDNAELVMIDGTIKSPIFEYYVNENKAIARDGVKIVSEKGEIIAETAVAYLVSEKARINTQSSVKRFELFDDVVIKTADEEVKGNKSIYNVLTGVIVVEGDVSIKKGKNILKGDIAEVNLKSGISKLRSTSRKRIGGTISSPK